MEVEFELMHLWPLRSAVFTSSLLWP